MAELEPIVTAYWGDDPTPTVWYGFEDDAEAMKVFRQRVDRGWKNVTMSMRDISLRQ